MASIGERFFLLEPNDEGRSSITTFLANSDTPGARSELSHRSSSVHRVGSHLMVIGWDPNSFVQAYDVSDGVPRPLGRTGLKGWAGRYSSAGHMLYLNRHKKIDVVNADDPRHIVVEGSHTLDEAPDDLVALSSGFVYITQDSEIEIVDARRPSDPDAVGEVEGFERLQAVRVTADERHLLVFDRHFIRSGLIDGELSVFNIDAPMAPRLVGSVTIPSVFDWTDGLKRDFGPILVELHNNHLILAAHELIAIDVSAPSDPKITHRVILPQRSLGLKSAGQTVLVAQEGNVLEAYTLGEKGALVASSGRLDPLNAGRQTSSAQVSVNLYVDGEIELESCTDYTVATRACGAGTEPVYKTLEGVAAVAGPGDTVHLRQGSYEEALIVQRSGTATDPITFRNYKSEVATITGASLSPAIDISEREHIVLEGLEVTDVRRWLYAVSAHHNTIRNNTFRRALDTGHSQKACLFFQEATFNKILNNVIEDCNEDSLYLVKSDNNLVVGNEFRKAYHTLWAIKCGNNNVLRDNYFHNEDQKIGEVYDCHDVGFDREFYLYDATKRNLIEGNEFAYVPSSGDRSPYSGIQYAGQDGIIRRNRFHSTVGPGLSMTLYGDEARFNCDFADLRAANCRRFEPGDEGGYPARHEQRTEPHS